MDGIDVAVADLALEGGEVTLAPIAHDTFAYPADLRADILAVLPPATTTIGAVCRLDTRVGRAFAAAARHALDHLCPAGRADLVASHGQTVFHWVEEGAVQGTLQLGQPAWIVEETGLPVVSDPRSRDIAAGGQGAPLASTLDTLWLAGRDAPVAALNLGGIANLTVVAPDGTAVAFDTGPGNALLDAAAARLGEAMDRDGRRALRGRVHAELLARLRAEPYYARPFPKTTSRELFHAGHLAAALRGLEVAEDDVFATLAELTASTVADACRGHGVTEVVASGGGVRNPALVAALRRTLAPVPLRAAEDHGIPSDAKEAYLFALLGFLTWRGAAATVPSCTGARVPTPVGRVSPASATLPFPRSLRVVSSTGGAGR
ncbi:anhydro-N-acetylmuramic acid kinase [Marinactinospora endophytica]